MRTYTIVIEENVPLARKTKSGNIYVHPLSWLVPKLRVNDSFLYPASTGEHPNNLRSIANKYAKQLGYQLATRTVIDKEGVGRVRFYRTA
jgi:hypothetical protein